LGWKRESSAHHAYRTDNASGLRSGYGLGAQSYSFYNLPFRL
jgi:hypothetical protein